MDLAKLKRPATILSAAIAIVGLGVGIVAFCKLYDYPFVANEAPQAAQAYKAAGLPWEAVDIQPTPIVKPQENANPDLQKAIALLPSTPFYTIGTKVAGFAKEADYRALGAILKPYAPALQQAKKAAQKECILLSRDWDLSFSNSFIEPSATKTICQALSYRAISKAGLADPKGALEDLQTSWRLGSLLPQIPDVMAALVSFGCAGETLRAMEQCAQIWKSDPATLTHLRDLTKQNPKPIDWRFIFRGEIYTRLAWLRNTDFEVSGWINEAAPPRRAVLRTGLPENVRARAYLARYLSVHARAAPILDDNAHDVRNLALELSKVYGRIQQKSLSAFMDGILFPTMNGLWKSEYRTQAHLRCLQLYVEALLIQNKTGRLPTKIEEIPGNRQDPFSGQPLHLTIKDQTLRIYSVGPNGEDNKGLSPKEAPPHSNPSDYDDIITPQTPKGVTAGQVLRIPH